MFEVLKKFLSREGTDRVDCLKQLKSAGATPWQMTLFGVLNFAVPSMWKSLMVAVAVGIVYGAWK